MHKVKKAVKALQSSNYLSATIDGKGYISNFNLLINGIKYSEQILKHWQRTHSLDKEVSFKEMNLMDSYFCEALKTRHKFIYTKEFHESIRYLLSKSKSHEQPSILKSVHTVLKHESLEGTVPSSTNKHTYLETLYLIPSEKGFSVFFNSQRACKIWWMRFSADPSKYFVEPYEFEAASNLAPSPGTQSITIKSKLPYATLDVESITVIPLHTASLDADFAQYLKINNKTRTIPSVIRSVIDLQAATGAVLFDSVDNERENTLLLNRKLAPFQCVVTCYHEGKQLKDLEDLCLHIQYILSRSGLRIMGENILFTNSLQELESEIFKCDNLGVPYLLIISESSLHNGLLKLRNRDTTLEETIHISDLPNYLLQIFS
ncbi:DNA polymerase subunit gamma-2, mitochondrial [Ceratitis capitata]|uniref:DNA polymerase subunit gamma-2, mitochondrial n=1 Tax=Ceratitis capitata TaxID=7213 RepID=UPI0003296DEA|nr:DNA polymerase subunit gamma-2, mitochondrial [Ceratitis capitata]